MDFAQICIYLIHGHGKKLKKSFGDLDLIFKITLENQIAKLRPKILKCFLPKEWVSGFYPNLHEFNIWT